MLALFALASSAAAYNATTTVESIEYVTIPCSSGDVVSYGSYLYTATAATTLTVEHCSCTASPSVSSASPSAAPSVAVASSTIAPALANGAAAAKVGAVAAGAAAVAYLL